MAEHYYPGIDFSQVPRLAGVPRFMYRQPAGEAVASIRNLATATRLQRLIQQLQMVRLCGMMWECRRIARSHRTAKRTSMTAADAHRNQP
jgi:hypothetical protein